MQFLREKNQVAEGQHRFKIPQKNGIFQLREKIENRRAGDVLGTNTAVHGHPAIPIAYLEIPVEDHNAEVNSV